MSCTISNFEGLQVFHVRIIFAYMHVRTISAYVRTISADVHVRIICAYRTCASLECLLHNTTHSI